MSRFFKYKTADSLARDAEGRGLDVRVSDDLSVLREGVDVAGRRVGNRLAVQPMEGCDATPDGDPDELTIRRYRRFGDGGAKLIWGEAAAVVPEGRANPRQLVVDEGRAGGLARLVATCRDAHRRAWGRDDDLLVGLQLTHSGRYSVPRPILAQHDPLLDPRTIVDKATGTTAGPDGALISDEELDRLQDRYVAAARVASQVGFDFIDLKQCHRYFLNELLAARTRPGRYGGSFEDRTRFVRAVVGRIRDEVPGLLIGTRLNVFDGIPYRRGADGVGVPEAFERPIRSAWGTNEDDPDAADLAEPIELIRLLQGLGVSLVNVTAGNPYASPHLLRPFEYSPVDGYETPEHPLIGVARHFRLTAAVQSAFPDLAVVGSGYSWLQGWMFHAGAANVRDGRATFVGVGRGALSHPDFARYVLEGRPLDPKRTCRTFSYCTALMRSKHHPLGQFPAGCPPFDKEVYGPIWDEARRTRPGSPA
ncbi:MAG TPA: NADH:flavin oxidoreductase [Isosphaeraceae bacterium]|jgi:2,4-dienoyl-CoA reductase-like NADH-dependent reductase (Old Yellow Enzyme family)|nr:NADH:flavin oxidoreductase [Isosphaeraceae bacterium]